MHDGTSASNSHSNGNALLKSADVMAYFGYRNRCSFWDFVRRHGVPHVRLNARRIMFEEQALTDWIARRSTRSR